MRYREIVPPAEVTALLECLWVLEGTRGVDGSPAETVLPDGCIEVIVHLQDPFRRRGEKRAQPQAFLVGPMAGPLSLEAPARVRTVGIRFRPGGAAILCDGPLADLADRDVALEDLAGPAARRLVERLGEARDDSGIASAAGAFISDVARSRRPADAAVIAAVAEILRNRGRITRERLALRCRLEPRTLERRFRAAVGFSPKRLSRIVRFQRMFRELQAAGSGRDWVDVALRCGYFDQAHLIRDFRELSGEPPAAFFQSQGELSRRFTSPERLDRFFRGA